MRDQRKTFRPVGQLGGPGGFLVIQKIERRVYRDSPQRGGFDFQRGIGFFSRFFVVVVFQRHARFDFVRMVELRIDFEGFIRGFASLGVELFYQNIGRCQIRLGVLRIDFQSFLIEFHCFVRSKPLGEQLPPADPILRIVRVGGNQRLKQIIGALKLSRRPKRFGRLQRRGIARCGGRRLGRLPHGRLRKAQKRRQRDSDARRSHLSISLCVRAKSSNSAFICFR